MVTATFHFYKKNIDGNLDYERIVYKATGERKEDIDIKEVIWQAIEVEGFDLSEVYVSIYYKENGFCVDFKETIITADVVRTTEPSECILWDNREPPVFKIDREKSKLYVSRKGGHILSLDELASQDFVYWRNYIIHRDRFRRIGARTGGQRHSGPG